MDPSDLIGEDCVLLPQHYKHGHAVLYVAKTVAMEQLHYFALRLQTQHVSTQHVPLWQFYHISGLRHHLLDISLKLHSSYGNSCCRHSEFAKLWFLSKYWAVAVQ